jgi:hypothetical protein
MLIIQGNTVELAGYEMKTESVAVDIRTASGVGIQLVFATCVSVLPLE